MLTGSRLTLARKRRGFTMRRLAAAVEVTERRLHDYEHGRGQPSDDTIRRLVEVLGFSREFFFAPELETPSPTDISFRALSNLTASKMHSAVSSAVLGTAVSDWISERFDLPPVSVPDLPHMDPETAAEAVRAEWKLGLRDIKSMIHLLESHGARVFSLPPEDAERVDAFCFWRNSTPFIFLNSVKSMERCRFDAAHELAHLVLHRHGKKLGREDAEPSELEAQVEENNPEVEANRFASAFLMPRRSVIANCPRHVNLQTIIKMKAMWGVSAAALTTRLHHLKLISDWHYRQLFIQLSSAGYRKSEPAPMMRETSQLLMKVFASLKAEGLGRRQIAKDLHIPPTELDLLMNGLVLTSLEGEGKRSSESARPHLKLL